MTTTLTSIYLEIISAGLLTQNIVTVANGCQNIISLLFRKQNFLPRFGTQIMQLSILYEGPRFVAILLLLYLYFIVTIPSRRNEDKEHTH